MSKGKNFVALFLIFSLLALSANLYAEKKRGANIEIYNTKPKIEGTPWETPDMRGELIAVKENSLLLLDAESGADESVDINEIYSIKIVRSSNQLLFAGVGVAIGFGVPYLASKGKTDSISRLYWGLLAITGGALGLLVGVLVSSDETIQIEGKSDSEIQEILEKLRKKARVRNSQ